MIPKLSIPILCILAFCTPLFGQPSSVNIEGMSGPVKRVYQKQTTTTEKNGKEKEDFSGISESFVFDKQGRLTYETFDLGDSSTEKHYSYEKDGVRKCVSQRTQAFNKSGQEPRPDVYATVFKYDAAENSISEDTYTSRLTTDPVVEVNRLGQRYKYFFDNQNRLIRKIVLSEQGNEVNTYEYSYTSNGLPSSLLLTQHGRLLELIKYTYELDSKGNWTKRTGQISTSMVRTPPKAEVAYRKISYYGN